MPEKKGNTDVSEEELQAAAQAIGCTPKEILTQAPIRLYKCDPNESKWTYTGAYGILSVIADMSVGYVTLKLVDLQTKKVSFEQECYEGFTFQKLSESFHCFESDDFLVGLSFAEDFDSERFCFKVSGLIKHTNSIPSKKTSIPAPKKAQKKEEKKKQGWFTGFPFFGKKKQQPQRPTKLNISGPKNFQHVRHIGFTKDGFTGEIPDAWKQIFKKAGVTEEQLKDKKTAKFIMKTIVNAPPPPPLEDMEKKVSKPKIETTKDSSSSSSNSTSSGSSSSSGGSGGDEKKVNLPAPQSGRDDLLAAIRKGKPLKKAEIPKVEELTEREQNNIADTISKALALRREAVESDEDEEGDDDWEC